MVLLYKYKQEINIFFENLKHCFEVNILFISQEGLKGLDLKHSLRRSNLLA